MGQELITFSSRKLGFQNQGIGRLGIYKDTVIHEDSLFIHEAL